MARTWPWVGEVSRTHNRPHKINSMLDQPSLARIAIILVRARNPNNIGAVARAMHDFGYSSLRIVNDFAMPLEGARSAVDASAVIHTATTYASVAEAVADSPSSSEPLPSANATSSIRSSPSATPRRKSTPPSPISTLGSPSSSAPKKPASQTKSSATATSS